MTITFRERGGKTGLALRQTGFKSLEARDGHKEGWTSTLAKYIDGYVLPVSTKNLQAYRRLARKAG